MIDLVGSDDDIDYFLGDSCTNRKCTFDKVPNCPLKKRQQTTDCIWTLVPEPSDEEIARRRYKESAGDLW